MKKKKSNTMKSTLNPFTRELMITHNINGCTYENTIQFTDLDEWSSFRTDKLYDIHFLYDSWLSLEIFAVKNGKIDYTRGLQ
jgi:hypothetical protein